VSAGDWQRVKEVLADALMREPAARADFLDHACQADRELRREVEALLASHDDAGEYLSRGPEIDPAGARAVLEYGEPARRVGPYRILGMIARGGMGTVYRAVRDDDAFEKIVALKLVRAGAGSDFVERRFRQERQILARLQHPNIAAILDGGTSGDGQPYLVMEHVEGRPITGYCDEHGLGTRERLALFGPVCAAVQYAHQNLVVHRDLKPDNILVTAEGTPKLLDFGIAKMLAAGVDPETAPTATLLPMMTPEYASPEQVRGEPVTTASDVYSLGVLLYELLAGCRPYRVKADSLEEIVRAVCDTDPPPPSTVVRTRSSADTVPHVRRARAELKGDLDTIVMKALRKHPARRYASPQELWNDLHRYLDGRPVRARPDTVRYRASKFVRRHKAGVATSALVASSLLAAAVITAREARIAERRSQETRKLANSLVFEAFDAVKNIPGATAARAVMVKTALEYLDRLAAQPGQDATQRLELSTAYVKLGDAQGQPEFANLGDTRGALESYRKAMAIRERLVAEAPGDPRTAQQLATVHNRMGRVLRATGDVAAALDHHRLALRIAEDAARALGDVASRRRLVTGHWELCNTFVLMGNATAALREAREGLAVARQLLAESPSADTRMVYAAPIECEGDALALAGDAAAALPRFLESQETSEELASDDPLDGQSVLDAVNLDVKVGDTLAALGRTAEARVRLDRAIQGGERLVAIDARDIEGQLALADARRASADLTARTTPALAVAEYGKAVAAVRRVAGVDPADLRVTGRLATVLMRKGAAERASGLAAAAQESLAEAARLTAELRAKAPAIR
jgi:serine/threonine protein kinase/tetratricopeptide (TPR) repeat protein